VRACLVRRAVVPKGDADVGIVCSTCHDPHQTNGYPAQLRYPTASTNDYFMSSNSVFARQYNPKINVCGQCHNDLGASWTYSSGAPHSSPQYNILLGTVGELDSGLKPYQPGGHALLLTNQCVDCHMQTAPYQSETQPAVTGHTFKVETYNVCLRCHTFEPEELKQYWQGTISNWVAGVQFDLDYWATNAAPASTNKTLVGLSRKYGTRAWEYTTPGQLSPGGPGPNAAEQKEIPENIRKARFNLYLVIADGSYGIHNPLYILSLLETADGWIVEEVNQ
jgi:formate-dependent nitrite reductase cytochrome c552 subunit